jgi:hypothetical protein
VETGILRGIPGKIRCHEKRKENQEKKKIIADREYLVGVTGIRRRRKMSGKRGSLILAMALAVSLFGGVASKVSAGGDELAVLRGLKGVHLVVEKIGPQIKKDSLTSEQLTEQLTTDAETKLKMAGIKLLSFEEWMKEPGSPALYINPNILKTQYFRGYVCNLRMELQQKVSLVRNSSISGFTPTWSQSRLVVSPSFSYIRDRLKDLVDSFINDYLKANPKQ